MSEKFSDFDLDYANGKLGEDMVDAVVKVMASGTIEVKRDMKWYKTGNIYIETACYYQKSGMWEDSGLTVTKATHWSLVLGDGVLTVPTDLLRRVVEVDGTPISTDIQPNPSRGFLIRPESILQALKYA